MCVCPSANFRCFQPFALCMINLDTQSYGNIVIINTAFIGNFTIACFINLIDALVIKYPYRHFKISLYFFLLNYYFAS